MTLLARTAGDPMRLAGAVRGRLAACYIPARRAVRVHPTAALRCE